MSLRHLSLPRSVASFGRTSTLRVAALGLVLAAAAACSDDKKAPVAPEPIDITLSQTSVTLIRSVENPTPSTTVSAEVTGTSNADLVWKVRDPGVATVSQSGVITAVADGQTFVTVRSLADTTRNRSVVVNVVSTVVRVTPATEFLYEGGPSRQLSSVVENNTNTNVTWSSSNESVATVSSTGVVTPVGTGSANIIATSEGDPTKTAASIVRVDPAPHSGFIELPVNTTVATGGATGTQMLFWFYAPAGTSSIKVTHAADNGDADIAVYYGNATAAQVSGFTGSNLACYSAGGTSNESCSPSTIAPRLYYILVDAYGGYQNGTLTVTTTP